MSIYRAVRETFEAFYSRRRREREECARNGGDQPALGRKQEIELEEFHKTLDKLAREMRPAGKMVRRKGIAEMFT